MSLLALDVGSKKVGVAFSESGLLASEFSTIGYQNESQIIIEILFLIKRNKSDIIVVGLPKNIDGSESKQTAFVRNFTNKLIQKLKSSKIKTRVVFEDETLTSKEAERILFEQGKSLEQVRERRDQLAAKLILDQYLNRK